MSQKVRSVLLVTLITVFMGLVFPLTLGFMMAQQWGLAFGFVMIAMLCFGWPGYMLWASLWACRDIQWRWFIAPLFTVLLASTCGAWLGWLWPIGVVACAAMLGISVIVMFVTVSSKTEL